MHLSCEVTGDPPPGITWFKRDVELFPPNSFISSQGASATGVYSQRYPNIMPLQGEQILQLTNVQKADAGDYTCMASNGGDAIEKRFNLNVIRMFWFHFVVFIYEYASFTQHPSTLSQDLAFVWWKSRPVLKFAPWDFISLPYTSLSEATLLHIAFYLVRFSCEARIESNVAWISSITCIFRSIRYCYDKHADQFVIKMISVDK